jgi:hypothetical protein
MPLRICVDGIPGSGKTAAIGKLKSGHLYPFFTVVGTGEKKAWLPRTDSPAPDTDVIQKAFWKYCWSPRTVAEIEWRVPTETPFRLTEGSSLSAAYVLAPVLHRHGWLTGEAMRIVQRKVNEHLVGSDGRNFVDIWVHLDCFVEDAIGRMKERDSTSAPFDKEFMLELQDGFLELFYSSQEQAMVGTDFCRQFVWKKNFFDYDTTGENYGPEKVARNLRESLGVHLPEQHKMFRDYEWAGGDIINIWKKDDEPCAPIPWFASVRQLSLI